MLGIEGGRYEDEEIFYRYLYRFLNHSVNTVNDLLSGGCPGNDVG